MSIRIFEARLKSNAEAIERRLKEILCRHAPAESVLEKAMQYALLGGGKRMRPFLLMETASLFGVARNKAVHAAAALECVHSYSLIHDDLPAMDNDDLRRGKPSVHKKFGEATAILAGDALLTLAFELLAENKVHADPAIRSELSLLLAKAAGDCGMVAGQMLDLSPNKLSQRQLFEMHALKTGALIRFACEAGAVLGGARQGERRRLRLFAEHFGAIYQLADDLADEKKDRNAKRPNAAVLLGTHVVARMIAKHEAAALAALKPFGRRAALLEELALHATHTSH